MKHKWLTATALAGMLALSPAWAQQGQPQEEQQQEPQTKEQQPEQIQREQQPEQQQPTGQQPSERQQPEQAQPEQMPPEEQRKPGLSGLSKEELVGKELYGSENRRIGKIRDVVQTPEGGIEAVVTEFGGFLGIGAKKVAVPADELEAQGDRIVAAQLTEKEIKKLPEFQKAESKPSK